MTLYSRSCRVQEARHPTKGNFATLIYGARLIAVRGNYDAVNRLCSQIVDRYPWGFVNVNLRPFYAEGSKTFGYEIAEQLGWRAPDAIVDPMAGGSLITKTHKGLTELQRIGLLKDASNTRLYGAQATGCNPIIDAVKRGTRDIRPVKPNTVAKSLAIGNPADGYYAAGLIAKTGGWGEDVTDEEIVAGIRLLAETEGIFTETAGGVTIAVTQKLLSRVESNQTISPCLQSPATALKRWSVSHVCDETGALKRFINVYINGADVRFLENLSTRVNDGAEVAIVPAISGGAS